MTVFDKTSLSVTSTFLTEIYYNGEEMQIALSSRRLEKTNV